MLDNTKPHVEKIHYIDAELAGHVHKVDGKRQSLCGSGFSLFAVRMLAKPYHFGVNWPRTLCENKNGEHFFTLGYECHNRHNKLLLCEPQNGYIAWCNKNNSEYVFVFFFKKKNKNLFIFKKNNKNGWKKNKKTYKLFFFKTRFIFNPDYLPILFCDFPLIARSETIVTSLSAWLGMRCTHKV